MAASIWAILISSLLFHQNFFHAEASIKINSLICVAYDKSYGDFGECKLKAISRTIENISVSYLIAKDVNNYQLRVGLLKKSSGWKPFLFNAELSGCEFLRNRKKYVIANMIYKFFENSTNANHTCPYRRGENIIVKTPILEENSIVQQFPIFPGEYRLFTYWYADKKLFANVNGSFLYTNYRISSP